MSRGASSSSSMDAICLDEWDLPPDHESFFCVEECGGNEHGGGVGGKCQLLLGAKLVRVDMDHFPAASHRTPRYGFDETAAEKPLLSPSDDVHGSVPVTECKDMGVVKTESKREEAIPKATEILISGAEEEEEAIKFRHGVKEGDDQDNEALAETAAPDHHHHRFAGAEDEGVKKFGFSFGDLRAHGVGALCSFGVAAATFCVLLLGGKQQQGNRQNHKIRLQQTYADDDQRIQRQASRLNQTMSSVNGGGGASPSAPASISFDGHYRGF